MSNGPRIETITFSKHFIAQARTKNFTVEQIRDALTRPYKITDVTRYPGQRRYCGGGVAIVISGSTAITIYQDGVCTPLREDQKNDAAALNSSRVRRVR